jgi:hypothetical protein
MNLTLYIYYLTLGGLFCQIIIHIASLSGISVIYELPYYPLFAVYLFIPWLYLFYKFNTAYKKHNISYVKNSIIGNGMISIILIIIIIAYSMLFVPFFFKSGPGVTGIINGKYALLNHGELVRYISESDFKINSLKEQINSTSTIILFYALSVFFLRSLIVLDRNSNSMRASG